MSISDEHVQTFASLFAGYTKTYGAWTPDPNGAKDEAGKAIGIYRRVQKEIEIEDYRKHLEGSVSLGVVPITEKNTVRWAAIDVDEGYTDMEEKIARRCLRTIDRNALPLIPFRSKSGGLHLYCFFQEQAKAKDVFDIMVYMRRALMLNVKTEIFPKQTQIKEGAQGNFINLPYFNAHETNRYAMNADMWPYSFEDALNVIFEKMTTVDNIKMLFETLPMHDGPPCLQALTMAGGAPEGTRNKFLFSVGRYFKSKAGDDFGRYTLDLNSELDNPVDVKEVIDTVIASHEKKDYAYLCNEDPIVSLCDKEACKKREFGIGGMNVSALNYGDFLQYRTDPPYYEWTVNGKILRFFSESEIMGQTTFQAQAMRELHILPYKLKQDVWTKIVNNALANVIVHEVDATNDISQGSMFRAYFLEFLLYRAQALNKVQILMNRVFKDLEQGLYIFKPEYFVRFLVQAKQYKALSETEIQVRLKDFDAKPLRYYIDEKNTNTRVWSVPIMKILQYHDETVDGMRLIGASNLISDVNTPVQEQKLIAPMKDKFLGDET